jgi:two-component system, NtrC family, nitrogen regulation sensor histidine kinase NtrY
MGFKNFRAAIVLRLLLFCGFVFVAVWGYIETDWQLTPVIAAVLAALVVVETILYVESINRELAGFLEFIAHGDFSSRITTGKRGRVFEQLEVAYRLLTDQYRNLNQARELNHLYLEALVEHVSVALLCLDDDGNVTLMNRQAKLLFRTPHLHTLDSLKRIDPALPSLLDSLTENDRTLIRLQIDNESLQLALYGTRFRLLDRNYRLISFQNIRDELEQREVAFSQKLIKVMTHEIMNSVTPIIALSKVIEESILEGAVDRIGTSDPASADKEDLLRSVASIQSRGGGLLRFVQAYSSLTSLPLPDRSRIEVSELFEQLDTLLTPTLRDKNVLLEIHAPDSGTTVNADPAQLQQVLINLVNNAVEALEGKPNGRIVLSSAEDKRGKTLIKVADNGPGIEEDALEQIFVPFFTTKKNGTGVGLSVSRQIMFLNKGLISVRTVPGGGSEFRLHLR